VTDAIVPGRVSNARGGSKIGSLHKSDDSVEANLTPPARALTRLQLGAGRNMADHAEGRAGPCTQNGLVFHRYRGRIRNRGCEDEETGAEHDAWPQRHFFLSLIVFFAAPDGAEQLRYAEKIPADSPKTVRGALQDVIDRLDGVLQRTGF
jgi:hypothetical protein